MSSSSYLTHCSLGIVQLSFHIYIKYILSMNTRSISWNTLRCLAWYLIGELILGVRPANKRRRYFVTMSLIGWELMFFCCHCCITGEHWVKNLGLYSLNKLSLCNILLSLQVIKFCVEIIALFWNLCFSNSDTKVLVKFKNDVMTCNV